MTTLRLRARRSCAVLSAAVLGFAAFGAVRAADPVPPAVLNEIPSNAATTVVLSNVQGFTTKISNTATRLNLPFPLPPDLLGYVLRNMHVDKGFDGTGSAAMVILKPLKEGDDLLTAPPAFIILLPTTSAKDMLANFSPSAPDAAGISEVTLPSDTAEKGYVATVDQWVAFAQDREALVAYMAGHKSVLGKTLSADGLKSFTNNDLVVWGNMEEAGPSLSKNLENQQQELTGMLDLSNMTKSQDPTLGALQKELVNQYFSFSKEYLKDSQAAMVTLRLSDQGVTLGLVGDFKEGTPIAKFMAAQKAQPLSLTGLPAGEFLAAGAFHYDPQSVSDLVGSVAKQVMENEVIAKDPRLPDMQKLADQYKALIASASGESLVILPPPAGGKSGLYCASVLIDTPDAKKFLSGLDDILKNPLLESSLGADIKTIVTTDADAVTIKDIKLSKIHISYKLRAETPENPVGDAAKTMISQLQKLYGADGPTFYSAVVTGRVLFIIGSDATTLEGSVDAAINNAEGLNNDSQISTLKAQVVPNAVVVGYLPITRWITLGMSIAQAQTADATQPAAPPAVTVKDAPPLLMSAGITGTTLTQELYVPIDAITSTIDAFKAVQRPAATPDQPAPAAPTP